MAECHSSTEPGTLHDHGLRCPSLDNANADKQHTSIGLQICNKAGQACHTVSYHQLDPGVARALAAPSLQQRSSPAGPSPSAEPFQNAPGPVGDG